MVSRRERVELASSRLDRERVFHDHLAQTGYRSLRLIDRLTQNFYDKDTHSIVWGPVWQHLDVATKTVLDYGCGSGDFCFILARRGAVVYGIDISPRSIDLARKRQVGPAPNKPEFLVRDGHQTGFPDSYFDIVFGNGILHHLDPERAYAEIARILKPGGRAVFVEPLNGHPLLRLARWMTPRLHAIDERPLGFEDIVTADRFFSRVWHSEYFLLAVAAAPFNLIDLRAAKIVIQLFNGVDQIAFRVLPKCRRFAWVTLIELMK